MLAPKKLVEYTFYILLFNAAKSELAHYIQHMVQMGYKKSFRPVTCKMYADAITGIYMYKATYSRPKIQSTAAQMHTVYCV